MLVENYSKSRYLTLILNVSRFILYLKKNILNFKKTNYYQLVLSTNFFTVLLKDGYLPLVFDNDGFSEMRVPWEVQVVAD